MRDYVILIVQALNILAKVTNDRHDLFCNLCFHLYTCF